MKKAIILMLLGSLLLLACAKEETVYLGKITKIEVLAPSGSFLPS